MHVQSVLSASCDMHTTAPEQSPSSRQPPGIHVYNGGGGGAHPELLCAEHHALDLQLQALQAAHAIQVQHGGIQLYGAADQVGQAPDAWAAGCCCLDVDGRAVQLQLRQPRAAPSSAAGRPRLQSAHAAGAALGAWGYPMAAPCCCRCGTGWTCCPGCSMDTVRASAAAGGTNDLLLLLLLLEG